MIVVNVRLEAPTEHAVREAARQMGVQTSRVKQRNDGWHLYGTTVVKAEVVTVTSGEPRDTRHGVCQLPVRRTGRNSC